MSFHLSRTPWRALGLIVFVFALSFTSKATAQQVNIGTPFGSVSDSFFERNGVGFSARGNGWFFDNNTGAGAIPQFGGYTPNAGLSTGFAIGGGDFNAQFGLSMASGSSRTFTSNSPSVTIGNGGFGMIQETRWTPFITEIIPVVGNRAPVSPLADAIARLKSQPGAGQFALPAKPSNSTPSGGSKPAPAISSISSAERGALSVAEIKRRQAEEEEATAGPIQALLDEGRQQARSQNWKEARKAYYAALEIAPVHRQQAIREEIRAMERTRRGEKR